MHEFLIWTGILFCITQSACFSGLNLAYFSLNRMQLEIESGRGDQASKGILALRTDANFLLTTILWGNVCINVLLTLLSDSVLTGVAGFLFSTFAITLFGEIGPQAYFSRHAKRMATLLAPLLRFYQILLYPVAKPSALLLDLWLGKEGLLYMRERDLRAVIRKHLEADDAEVDAVEGMGALNFLAIDDLPASMEGEVLDDDSIISLPLHDGMLQFPPIKRQADDPFLQAVHRSGYSWVVLTDPNHTPRLVLDANGLLREALLEPGQPLAPQRHCHRPLLITDETETLGNAILQLKLDHGGADGDDTAITKDVILVWTPSNRKIITGADILGRLLKGIENYATAPKPTPGR